LKIENLKDCIDHKDGTIFHFSEQYTIMEIAHADLNITLIAFLLSCSGIQEPKNEKPENKAIMSETSERGIFVDTGDTSDLVSLRQLINSYSKRIDSFDKLRVNAYKNSKINTQSFRNSIQQIENSYYGLLEKRNAAIYNYLITHEKSTEDLEGVLYLVVDKKISIGLIDSIFKKFPLNLKNSTLGKLVAGKIEERKKSETISSYNPAILDLKFEGQDGKLVALNQVNSHFILLDFWASWCAPCRFENRVLMHDKEKITGTADVSIVAVSLDTNKDKWLKSSKEDDLSYLTICDFKALESPLCKGFRITTVPYNILIDKKGKIFANNLWGDKLINFLKTIK